VVAQNDEIQTQANTNEALGSDPKVID